MSRFLVLLKGVHGDECGASLVEYTVLITILITGVILTILAVGGWVSSEWASVNNGLTSAN
ncbi:Flp family type IVb pilin [Methylovirgula sp. 4M-Z18]|uniref:Flp family type IVb pilin n=1 Tax=Methylovirgula sp. 4M-Z18 TaxID=2293567 RepID=UPI001FE01177|nr:Flp family type IVb pilin [Methylovirgula sp. 4M-Z18]